MYKTTNRWASLDILIVCGWRKEGGKVKFVDKKSDLEIDRHNLPKQASELKTKKHDRSIEESDSEQQAITIARYKN